MKRIILLNLVILASYLAFDLAFRLNAAGNLGAATAALAIPFLFIIVLLLGEPNRD